MYYKIQRFDNIVLSWKDIQKSYDSIDEAIKHYKKDGKYRVMCVDGKRRFPIHTSD